MFWIHLTDNKSSLSANLRVVIILAFIPFGESTAPIELIAIITGVTPPAGVTSINPFIIVCLLPKLIL